MTSQSAAANLNKNNFGEGAKVTITVSNSSKKGDEKKAGSSSCAAIVINDSDDENNITLVKWLNNLHLDGICNKLEELGVSETEDMTLLDEEDLASLNLKKIEIKKLKRAIVKLRGSP